MLRFHKNICFPKEYDSQLNDLTSLFNENKAFKRSSHGISQLKIRFNLLDILNFLNEKIYFNTNDIFEYYIKNNNIIKVCYKMEYDSFNDIILVLSNEKAIITIYINSKKDNHKTLNKALYSHE
ncbi:MAG: hypothetical protein ACTSRG_27085 [Candidatus Helarchaeota archaeon]